MITDEVFEGHGLDLDDRVQVACGHCSPALQRKYSVVTVVGVEEHGVREWVILIVYCFGDLEEAAGAFP